MTYKFRALSTLLKQYACFLKRVYVSARLEVLKCTIEAHVIWYIKNYVHKTAHSISNFPKDTGDIMINLKNCAQMIC